jgi:iron complex transport system ATP-binding protein
MNPDTWRCTGLTVRYPAADSPALDGVTLEVPRGRVTAILGPNGSGKSTLLRALLGVVPAAAGRVELGGRPLSAWSRAALAREIGVVPQGEESAFPMTVREMVGMGRYPHLGPWRREGAADREAVRAAMARCDVEELAGRSVATLSGGERQRTRIARALAQQAPTLALDEPTAALDVAHEMEIFELVRALSTDSGATVLLVTHNLNLAARFADGLVLLDRGRVAASGAPAAVLAADVLERVYGWPVRVLPFAGPGPDRGAPQVVPLSRGARQFTSNERIAR